MAKKTELETVPVTVRVPKAVDDFLRQQFAPFEDDVMPKYQASFIRGVEEMLRDDFTEVPFKVWASLRKSAIPIPVTAQMRKALEEAAKDRDMSIDALVQQIIEENIGTSVRAVKEDVNIGP